MYPGIEVIKEVDRIPQSFRNGKKLKLQAPKSFEQIHVPLFLKLIVKKISLIFLVHMNSHKDIKQQEKGLISLIYK